MRTPNKQLATCPVIGENAKALPNETMQPLAEFETVKGSALETEIQVR